MGDTYRCHECKEYIYIGDMTENKFYLVPKSNESTIRQKTESNQKEEENGDHYWPLRVGLRSAFLESKEHVCIICPNCQTLMLHGKKHADFLHFYNPEPGLALPRITNPEWIIPDDVPKLEHLAEHYFENTPLALDSPLQCACGYDVREDRKKDYDYLAFIWLLILSASTVEEEMPEKIPVEKRMDYIYKVAYRGYVCSECERMIFIGKTADNKQFRAIYHKK